MNEVISIILIFFHMVGALLTLCLAAFAAGYFGTWGVFAFLKEDVIELDQMYRGEL